MGWYTYLFSTPESTTIDYLGWDGETEQLYVSLKKRLKLGYGFFHAYVYHDVSYAVFEEFCRAPSKGHFYAKHFRRHFAYTAGSLLELEFVFDSLYRNWSGFRYPILPGVAFIKVSAFDSYSTGLLQVSVRTPAFETYEGAWAFHVSVPAFYPAAYRVRSTWPSALQYDAPKYDNLYCIPVFYAEYQRIGTLHPTHVSFQIPAMMGSFILSSISSPVFVAGSAHVVFNTGLPLTIDSETFW